MKATLTAINHQPALLVTLKDKRQIPAIFRSLAQARSGLWPRHLEGSLISITSSKGEGEILKLLGSLSNKGYEIEISETYEQVAVERERRIAEIEARKRQDAIPSMGFAAKRFSFRSHPLGLRATFASQSAFKAWAAGHGIEILSYGKHHAYLPSHQRSRLVSEGIVLKGWQQPKDRSFIKWASCPLPPSSLLTCGVSFPELPAPVLLKPAKNSTKTEWVSYALSIGITEEALLGLKRDEIIAECDLMEAAASI